MENIRYADRRKPLKFERLQRGSSEVSMGHRQQGMETDDMTERKRHTAAISDIDDKIAKLVEQKKDLLHKRSERIAKLAADSGLAELDVADERIVEAFKEMAQRFRSGTTKP